MPDLNPEILTWARETAGLTLPEAAQKLGLRDSKSVTGSDRLSAIEAGEEEVSRPLLLKMVRVYRRPLVAFYLAKPPPRGERGEDYRTLPEEQRTEAAASVDALVRDIRARQAAVRTLLEDEDAPRLDFVGRVDIKAGVPAVVETLTQVLRFDLAQFRRQRTVEHAFNYLRDRAEAAGVFVLLIGNLGSHHSAIDVEVFRGFAIADDIAPFVVINDQDAKSAWSFTLLHELAHIVIGATGISGNGLEAGVERFCNDVASALLLPKAELASLKVDANDLAAVQEQITAFANERLVSRSLVAYRLHLNGSLTAEQWRAVSGAFRQEYLRDREERRERARTEEGGPTYHVVRRHKLGSALLQLVGRALGEGALTPTKASRILGVRPRNVESLVGRRAA